MTKWKIVVDSGCDLPQLEERSAELAFVRVPLTITVADQVFVDSEDLDIDQMMAAMAASKEAAQSACPSPQAYREAYEDAENILVLTITGGLSGSFNAARVAREMLLEDKPEVNIYLLDTLSAGGEIDLLVLEAARLIQEVGEFEGVVEGIRDYQSHTKLLFVLSKIDNLVKNGRVSKLLGHMVGLLNIRMVGEASDEGKLELLHRPRGHKKSLQAVQTELEKNGYQGGRMVLAHRKNDKFCQDLIAQIQKEYPQADIRVLPTSGLCSFYGEEGGILLGYEC
ncbi:DegV family protein [Streptococcus sp. DD13]|uniref:DegV family protein n=1 Tax=Streptococcus sp. DD13 TaxID=1777881 RepID=UPI0007933811|nr:DegV family protein [Streptococcus sp. DD13]KXT78550.1 DegV family protein [Streptococcus sp. DD13]